MKVLGIAGSPRRGGNSETLLDRFLAGARDAGAQVTKSVAADLDIQACDDCERCWENERCQTEDDYEEVCNEMLAADVVVVATPLYFWNVPAQLKDIIDRSQCLWVRQFVVDESLPPSSEGHQMRRGVLLAVGGQPERHFEGVKLTTWAFFRVFNTAYWNDLLLHDVDEQGAVEEHATALARAYDLGYRSVTEPWEKIDMAKMPVGDDDEEEPE
ncbi:MAG TPA: flavodoxin family protein [Anaerolineae bacterium]|nr:flavodoxin family protein [Anaerolineae bacterium]